MRLVASLSVPVVIVTAMLGHFPCVWLRCWSQSGWVEPVFWLFEWRLGAGWVGSRRIFLSDAGWTRPSKSGGRSRSSRVGSHQTLNSFNQTLNGAALSPILQPNTKMGWLHPQNQKCNQTRLAPSPKTGLDPTQPTQPPTKHTVRLLPVPALRVYISSARPTLTLRRATEGVV